MPWEHCSVTINDDRHCPKCGFSKAEWTVHLDHTRTMVLSKATRKGRPKAELVLSLRSDETFDAVPDVAYAVRTKDGRRRKGTLDAEGRARLEKLPLGTCEISFEGHEAEAFVEAPGEHELVEGENLLGFLLALPAPLFRVRFFRGENLRERSFDVIVEDADGSEVFTATGVEAVDGALAPRVPVDVVEKAARARVFVLDDEGERTKEGWVVRLIGARDRIRDGETEAVAGYLRALGYWPGLAAGEDSPARTQRLLGALHAQQRTEELEVAGLSGGGAALGRSYHDYDLFERALTAPSFEVDEEPPLLLRVRLLRGGHARDARCHVVVEDAQGEGLHTADAELSGGVLELRVPADVAKAADRARVWFLNAKGKPAKGEALLLRFGKAAVAEDDKAELAQPAVEAEAEPEPLLRVRLLRAGHARDARCHVVVEDSSGEGLHTADVELSGGVLELRVPADVAKAPDRARVWYLNAKGKPAKGEALLLRFGKAAVAEDDKAELARPAVEVEAEPEPLLRVRLLRAGHARDARCHVVLEDGQGEALHTADASLAGGLLELRVPADLAAPAQARVWFLSAKGKPARSEGLLLRFGERTETDELNHDEGERALALLPTDWPSESP